MNVVSVCWTGVVQGQVVCYTSPSMMCGGPTVSPSPPTTWDCCLGNGLFFQLFAEESCSQCVGEWSLDCYINNPCWTHHIKLSKLLGIRIHIMPLPACRRLAWPHACKCSVGWVWSWDTKISTILTVQLRSCSSSASPEGPIMLVPGVPRLKSWAICITKSWAAGWNLQAWPTCTYICTMWG